MTLILLLVVLVIPSAISENPLNYWFHNLVVVNDIPFSVLVVRSTRANCHYQNDTQLPSFSPYINVPIMVFRMQPSIVSSVSEAPS